MSDTLEKQYFSHIAEVINLLKNGDVSGADKTRVGAYKILVRLPQTSNLFADSHILMNVITRFIDGSKFVTMEEINSLYNELKNSLNKNSQEKV
jgi:hypothetical protein